MQPDSVKFDIFFFYIILSRDKSRKPEITAASSIETTRCDRSLKSLYLFWAGSLRISSWLDLLQKSFS